MARKKKIKWANIIILIFVVLVVMSFLWFGFLNTVVSNFMKEKYSPNPNLLEYNGYVFVKHGSIWFFDFEKDDNIYDIPIYFNPKEVENISSDPLITFSSLYKKSFYYISLDESVSTKSILSGVEIAKIWGQAEYGILNKQVKSALAYEYGETPYITCQNATENIGVILLKLSNNTGIVKDGECIILTAQNEDDMMKVADKLIYISLGIIE